MKLLSGAQFWLGFLSAGGVLWLVLRDMERTSPGELTSVHARVPELAGRSGCAQCHGGWGTSLAEACLECHGDVGGQIEAGLGLHGTFEGPLKEACALCHSDHHGADFAVVNLRSFTIAGVPDPDAFEHDLVGFAMGGKHLELECTECHEHADAPVLPEDARRFLGLDRDCATCHEDPHEGAMARSCAECHGQDAFDDLAPFVHDERFPLAGAHAAADCYDCHEEGSLHSVEALGGKGPEPPWRTCVDCHESPHRDPFVQAVAALVGRSGGESCATCHDAVHADFRDGATTTVAQHAASGFALELPHDEASCEQCHGPLDASFEERYPGRDAGACTRCHADAHEGFFEPWARRLAQAGDALEPDSGGAVQCTRCHLPTTFDDVPEGTFEHGAWTGFELAGAHAQSDCESCHARAPEPDAFGRTFGRVEEHFGRVEGCETCHESPHGARFDARDLPALVDGRAGCARCHVETSFRTLDHGFDHALWTGYPLEGAHGEVACAACHPTLLHPDDEGRTWRPARGSACVDCHADPHAGQFEERGATDCARCHESTASFAELVFDHDRDSRFPLEEAHALLECGACHKPWTAGEVEVVRFKPLGIDCVDCHGETRRELRSKSRRRR